MVSPKEQIYDHPRTKQKIIFEQLCALISKDSIGERDLSPQERSRLQKRIQRARKFTIITSCMGNSLLCLTVFPVSSIDVRRYRRCGHVRYTLIVKPLLGSRSLEYGTARITFVPHIREIYSGGCKFFLQQVNAAQRLMDGSAAPLAQALQLARMRLLGNGKNVERILTPSGTGQGSVIKPA